MKALSSAKLRLAAVAMILTLPMPPSARADIVYNMDVDSTAYEYNECTGEWIYLYGTVHILATVTDDGAGGQHTHVHLNYQDVRAIGLITGTTYMVPGAGSVELNLTTGAANETATTRARFVAPGGHNDLYVYQTIHATVDANGDETVEIIDVRIGCQ